MNKAYVVSGAATGIGKAIAKELVLRDSARLILVGRRREPLLSLANELGGLEKHSVLCADQSKKPELQREVAQLKSKFSEINGIIANAGVGGENNYGPEDRWEEIIGTDLTGTYYLIEAFLPFLKASTAPFKHIVITSSILSKIGVPHYSAYCASKAGLLGLTRSLAAELASQKILVNAICPGWVATDMAEQGLQLMSERTGIPYEKILTEQMKAVPLRKMSEPEEIAAFVRFLTSLEQCSITGQSLNINNGAVME